HQPQLGLERPVHGPGVHERLGCLGAPPPELLAALTPALASELGELRDDGPVGLDFVEATQGQLPAHLGLQLAVVGAGLHAPLVQRAPRTAGPPRPVEEDAGAVDEPGAPIGLTLVGADLHGDALLAADLR